MDDLKEDENISLNSSLTSSKISLNLQEDILKGSKELLKDTTSTTNIYETGTTSGVEAKSWLKRFKERIIGPAVSSLYLRIFLFLLISLDLVGV